MSVVELLCWMMTRGLEPDASAVPTEIDAPQSPSSPSTVEAPPSPRTTSPTPIVVHRPAPVLTPPPIPTGLRRPGLLLAAATTVFAASTTVHILVGHRCEPEPDAGCGDSASCTNVCQLEPLFLTIYGGMALDAGSIAAWGFAGKAYGLRDARRAPPTDRSEKRRRTLLGVGIASVIASTGLFAAAIGDVFMDEEDRRLRGYGIAGVRIAGVTLASGGTALIAYAVALWHGSVGVTRRSVSMHPTFGRESIGLSVRLR